MRKKLYVIQGVSDVITNSSTELFTLKTDKTLSEVKEFLKDNISGYYCSPEVMSKDKGVLKTLIDFGGYVYDPDEMWKFYNDQLLIDWLQIRGYNEALKSEADEMFAKWAAEHIDMIEKSTAEFISFGGETDERSKDFEYIGWWGVKDRILKYIKGNPRIVNKYKDWYVGKYFTSEFVQSLGDNIPEFLKLRPENNANNYVGKIGFMGEWDNSIPYEDFEVINVGLNGENWHLG